MKLQPFSDSTGKRCLLLFWCPGCKEPHPFRIALEEGQVPHAPVWRWNGDMERPTFEPSLLVNGNSPGYRRCHLFLRDGRIQFLSDCEHELAATTVDLPEWE